MEVKKVKLSALKLNDSNPRIIKDFKFQKLVKSLLTFPEMLKLREVVCDETMLILGGNMRCRALLHIAQMTENELRQALKSYDRDEYTDYWMRWHDKPMIDVKIAEGLSDEQKKEFIVKDNVAYGEWDWASLYSWDVNLSDWGLIESELKDDTPDKFKEKFNSIKNEDAMYPIVPIFDEKHEAFIIVSENEVDSNFLRDFFEMQKMGSYKRGKISKSNIIHIEDVIKKLDENRNTKSQES